MQHLILTRFNLVFENWTTDRNNNPILTEEWLKERFDLFLKYCFLSIKNQSCQNFKWLVFFNNGTDENYVKLIAKLQESYPNFIPRYIDGSQNLDLTIQSYIKEKLNEENFILTTRIDNDDVLHRDFVKTIQELAKPIHNLVIDIRKGYQMNLTANYEEFRSCVQNFNPFISIVQKQSDYQSIFVRSHTEWENESEIVIYDRMPLWIQIIHGRNKLNRINRHNRMLSSINFETFGYKPYKKQRSKLYCNLYNGLMKIYEKLTYAKQN